MRAGEYGDVRSLLDEQAPNGEIDLQELNKIEPNVTWRFDHDDGWSYEE